jgi:transaldolase
MLAQGKDMYSWIPNAHIKYPTITAGLSAAEQSIKAGMRVNMTLCFSQEQAAAVYSATPSASTGDVFVSPFIGRLDDIGEDGMALIDNILRMYKNGDGHSQVLAASIRTMDHFMQSLALGTDILTAPYAILEQWGKAGMPMPSEGFSYEHSGLKDIPYQNVELSRPWTTYDISHELTIKGVNRFASDWNSLIS